MRWIGIATLVSCLAVSAFYRLRARRLSGTLERRSEGPALIAARLVVTLPLLVLLVLTLFAPGTLSFAEMPLPNGLRALGAVLAVLTVPLVWWVFHSIGANISETVLTKTDHQLVTHGPYRWVRHPLYTSGTLLLLALALLTASALLLVFAVLAPLLIRVAIIPREEQALEAKFGQRYRDYRRSTGALLPRWS